MHYNNIILHCTYCVHIHVHEQLNCACREKMADIDDGLVSGMFATDNSSDWCYDYNKCHFPYNVCQENNIHENWRYTEGSAAWVLIASIIVFFMKAGFMLLEVAFARTPKEKRYVVVLKHQDAFASAFGFFLIGFDALSKYSSPIERNFFALSDPVLWFFKFTFASNAATIVGGCLVTNRYKLRLPAAFISAFVISGILHPIVARIIWSDDCHSLSPYRFCNFTKLDYPTCGHNCAEAMSLDKRLYILDFAGGGACHLLGGMAGLVVCLFARFQEWRDKRELASKQRRRGQNAAAGEVAPGVDEQEDIQSEGFWDWMYPVHGGEETVSEAALGVFILWFCWFAFNCGSTESVEVGYNLNATNGTRFPFYGVPSVIAVNMILAGASGGIVAILIATWAQVRYRTESVNANEIANGVLSALVSITSGCPFVDYWGACLIGALGVVFYHFGCWLEYKFHIKDTARVVPVHAVCGLWSIIATALFLVGPTAECNLHAAFEGLCYCVLRLPPLNYGERLLAQLVGALIMIGVGGGGAFVTYFILYIIPIKPVTWLLERVLFLRPTNRDGQRPPHLYYIGGWLLTRPEEEYGQPGAMLQQFDRETTAIEPEHTSLTVPLAGSRGNIQAVGQKGYYGATQKSNLGTHGNYGNGHTATYTSTRTRTHSSAPPSSGGGARVAYRKDGEPISSNFNVGDILLENEELSGDIGSERSI